MKRLFMVLVGVVLLWGQPVWAWEVIHAALVPGGFVVARVEPGTKVHWQGKPVDVTPEGLLFIGFDRAAKGTVKAQVCERYSKCIDEILQLEPREFKTQEIVGVPAKTVNPSKADESRIAKDTAVIKAARAQKGLLAAFAGTFSRPVEEGRESGVYGSRRTYNGEERNWHRGYDLAAPIGTPVYAPAAGIVRLARNTFMNGNLVILDHGYFVTTLYAHLDSIFVQEGQKIEPGQRLGTVGKTGRATGPHLHWGLFWHETPLDPHLLPGA